MAFARFGAHSDVYVYASVSGGYTCCGCSLFDPKDPDSKFSKSFNTPEDMIEHLEEHIRAGDRVPEYALTRLMDEATLCCIYRGKYSLDELNEAIRIVHELPEYIKQATNYLDGCC